MSQTVWSVIQTPGAVLGNGETCGHGIFSGVCTLQQLIPLFLIIGSGGVGAALYVMRLAVFNPDVCWDKKNNPEPWNKLSPSDQYKFYSVNVDYSKLKKDRPDF
nr:PREDICTED: NADH dehydrogenase [ubiquinone] 1 alpha subcomplex subunit 4 [Struthio camelus australis]